MESGLSRGDGGGNTDRGTQFHVLGESEAEQAAWDVPAGVFHFAQGWLWIEASFLSAGNLSILSTSLLLFIPCQAQRAFLRALLRAAIERD